MRKHTIEYVKNYFLDNGCEFIDEEYINVDHPHNYKCICRNLNKISFANFQKGTRCKKCSGTEKLTLEHIKNYFSNNGCLFLDDEYVNAKHKHNYICLCENKSKINFSNFQSGNRCMKCGIKKNKDNQKLTLEHVKNYFLNNGCLFLDDEYVNAKHKHNYICLCKNKSMISFTSFQKGARCAGCAGNKKHTLENIKKYFLNNNCEFLDNEYVGSNHPHNYICICGNKSKISFSHFQNGSRCMNCAKTGFNSSKPSFVYLVGNHYRQKIGIMNENADRIKQHNKNFGLNLIDKIFFENGADAYELEQTILQKLKIKNIPHGRQVFNENFDGRTESWLLTDLEVTKIEELINL